MNASFYWQFVFHILAELAAALAVVVWVAQGWQATPVPLGVRLVRQTGRLWLAIIYAVLPGFLGLLMRWPLLQLYRHDSWSFARVPLPFLLSSLYGILLGLAASCCASSVDANEKFRLVPALSIGLLLVVVPNLLWVGTMPLTMMPFVVVVIRFVLVVSIVVVAHLCIAVRSTTVADGATAAGPPPLAPPRRSSTLALLIGFAPSVFLLAGFSIAATAPLSNDASAVLLWLGSGASVICCFTASVLMFSRKTGPAILWGIILLLLNGFIAFFFGCCASLSHAKF
jgi:hypothetical protein